MSRPLFCFAASFLAATTLSLLVEGWYGPLWTALAAFLFCLLRPGPLSDHKGTLLAAGLACLIAMGLMRAYQARMDRWEPLVGQAADFTGWVLEEDPYLPGRGKVRGSLRLEGEDKSTSPVLLDIRGLGDGLVPGGWVSGRLLVSQVRQNGDALGGVSLYCIALGEAEDTDAPTGLHPQARLAALRWAVSQRVWERFRDQPAAVVLAMVFSRQDLLSQPVLEQMNRAGLRHLLVVSGLHLSMAAGWVLSALRQLRLKQWAGNIIALAAVWLLAGLAGFSVSVVRAAVMSTLWLTGRCLEQQADGLTSLAAAAVLLISISPPVVLKTGFQLSFSATLGVLLGTGPMAKGLLQRWESRFGKAGPLSRWVLEGLSVSLCAQLGTLPVLAAAYGQFPVWGLLATPLAMPFAAGIILLGFAGCVLLWAGTAAAPELLLGIARGLARVVLALAGLADRLPVGMIPVLLPYQLALCLLVPAAVFTYLRLRPKMTSPRARMLRQGAVLAAALVCVYHIIYYHQGAVLISADGNTGAVVISAPGGTLVLAEGEDDYHHRMVSAQLLRCGGSGPLALVCPWDSSANGILWWGSVLSPVLTVAPEEETTLLQGRNAGDFLPLTQEPAEVLPGILVSHPYPEVTCVEVCGKKVLKCWAGYGIMAGRPLEGDLLIDMDGRVYPVDPGLRPGRMPIGDTNLLLPAGSW